MLFNGRLERELQTNSLLMFETFNSAQNRIETITDLPKQSPLNLSLRIHLNVVN